eukprot:TRINITY_DN47102_c0_g1_i1.p1 TRINITY_DN47102_c0_g1~~TRINITY_DN47102_c0_g1_i1.p1  ORF type:complete len:222 (-),score=49.02 TRINITY_DN47102_c0_g1_i1:293-958(-)
MVQGNLLVAMAVVESNMADCSVTDHGHAFSSGKFVVQLWIAVPALRQSVPVPWHAAREATPLKSCLKKVLPQKDVPREAARKDVPCQEVLQPASWSGHSWDGKENDGGGSNWLEQVMAEVAEADELVELVAKWLAHAPADDSPGHDAKAGRDAEPVEQQVISEQQQQALAQRTAALERELAVAMASHSTAQPMEPADDHLNLGLMTDSLSNTQEEPSDSNG